MEQKDVKQFKKNCDEDIQPLIEGVANCCDFASLKEKEDVTSISITDPNGIELPFSLEDFIFYNNRKDFQ